MTCKKIQITYSDTPADTLPAEVRRHLETCSDCRAYFRECRDLRDLVRFKRYEQPAPEVAGRILYRVRARIEAMESLTPAPVFGGWRIGLRYAALASLAVLVFFNIQRLVNAPEPQTSGVAGIKTIAEPTTDFVALPLLATTNDPTRVFYEDPLVFGFAPQPASTNFFRVRRPPPSSGGNFQFINYRP